MRLLFPRLSGVLCDEPLEVLRCLHRVELLEARGIGLGAVEQADGGFEPLALLELLLPELVLEADGVEHQGDETDGQDGYLNVVLHGDGVWFGGQRAELLAGFLPNSIKVFTKNTTI